MNVLGTPSMKQGPIGEKKRCSIHRKAPAYEELAGSNELLETGIKVIDLIVLSRRVVKLVYSVVRVLVKQ